MEICNSDSVQKIIRNESSFKIMILIMFVYIKNIRVYSRHIVLVSSNGVVTLETLHDTHRVLCSHYVPQLI